MAELDLNSPEARQAMLEARAGEGASLSLPALVAEFRVSPDTVRRDLLALEARGIVRRVRGGALPVMRMVAPMATRMRSDDAAAEAVAVAALSLVEDGMVLMLDGGTTVLRLARALPALPRGLVVTPAPAVAMATLAAGTPTHLIGGRLSPFGGVAVGRSAEQAVGAVAADLALMGACGIEAGFGLSADDADEAALKAAMVAASAMSAVLTGAAKVGRRARHRVAECAALDLLVTDATPEQTAEMEETGLEIRHA
ncbi:transcriptional regulator, DeoR family [Palleronia marisminoris]|uniref:HTH-type transcriptional repressor GlcR n=1 Tax=Palleronia marisminoris TaxID=315423 RepID=A0A1Y5TI94_9RHOB|nr:DeoR/GlpR family DNA-binding transcription regulator [Palleronia marisminoris]SFH39548.1 transcriptional regulator, DeoR family [Palleronia marisminoris]SLN64555.1 HTH-type transcriptional repressor GlcR [Palleronia marisminoris]